ncbi:hypothetical protein [Streptomyces sp. NPDC008139]|uniref:hypothetical protein n=1 Tax=Streptomyces sp. NPDC008139 TaxID=3364814 RepID=UPI0036E073D5
MAQAGVYTDLHRTLRAVPLLSDVLSRYDANPARELALYLSWLAVAFADANEPEAAAQTTARMLTLTDGGSERTAERARVVLQRLRAFREVPERTRQPEAYTSTPTCPAPVGRHVGQPDCEGQPVTDRSSDHCDLTAGHRTGHRDTVSQRDSTDTTLVISHWQYTGSGLLPELTDLAALLAAAPKPRPEQPSRHRHARRSRDRAGHSTGPLTAATPAEVTA